jgi:UTP--glucose-1-phosphate uridylyltransferase
MVVPSAGDGCPPHHFVIVDQEEYLLAHQEDPVDPQFAPFAAKMRREGVPENMIRVFRHYYAQLVQGATGYIPATEARPVSDLPAAQDLGHHEATGRNALEQTVVIKLNGGLGTSMGMSGPKSLVEVKKGLSFLDITVNQILYMRRTHGVRLPLVLMNSFNTRAATLAALKAYPALQQDLPDAIPLDFIQHKVPKIWVDDLTPATWPQDPRKEWCPPGHGDIYLTLLTNGLLDQFLERGYRYAFVSNIDNLGATVDMDILGYFVQEELPFLMEVAHRTAADRKGGHLAHHPRQGLILRELAQCPPEEVDAFQDIERYRYFNTNNLWVHLPTLKATLDQQNGVLGLPLIRNEKPIDPSQPDSPRVYQLETAMGLAIATFPDAQAVEVPRSRFLPVKRTNDLLAIWSDAYALSADYRLQLAPHCPCSDGPLVELDDRYYGLFDQLKAHFPSGPPSLCRARRLQVQGEVFFGSGVIVQGDAIIQHTGTAPLYITENTHLGGD